MNRVFISYQRSNQAFAERLARDLGDAGLDVWIDLRQIQAGELWEKEIYRGLERVDVLVACLSKKLLQSEWCQREIMTARSAGKPIYPVMVEECFAELQAHPVLSWLTTVQFIRFEDRYEKAFPELLAALPGGRKLGAFDDYDPAKLVNPFKGLEAFQQRDAPFFFGREDLTRRAVSRLRRTRFLAVVGASGSGKSSLVRAGIIPQIRAGAIPGSENYPVVIFTPGAKPVESLALRLHPLLSQHDERRTPETIMARLRVSGEILNVVNEALTGLPEATRLVMVIDQFEEVFTRAGEAEREQFLDAVTTAATVDNSRAVLIVTMRADFFSYLSRYPELARLFEGDNLLIATEMTTANLLRAIEGPAQAVGLKFEQGLVDKILEDVKEQPGSLPLLQYALKELYERREGAKLTLAAYEAIGGVKQALARHAEGIFSRLNEQQQNLMRRVLLRLVEVSESGEITRRRVSLDEMKIRGVPDAEIQNIVDLLTAPDARLLIASRSVNTGGVEPVIWLEVSHEALIREWDRFKSWVTASVEDLRYETELRKAGQDWQNSGRDPAYLLLGKRLSRAEIWREDNEVTPVQHELIEASLQSRTAAARAEKDRLEREVQLQRQSVRRARLAAGAMVLLLLAALIGVFAVAQTNSALAQSEANLNNTNNQLEEQIAITQRNEAAARSLAVASSASQALADNDPDLALALAVEANSTDDTPPQAERALADIALATGTRLRVTTESRVTAVDFTPDNTRLAVGMQNGSVILIEANTGAIIQRFGGHKSTITDVAVSPDGSQLLSASTDATENFILWDITTGQPVRQWTAYDNQKVNAVAFAQAGLPINVTDDVTQIATSADGQVIVVGTRNGTVRRIRDTGEIVWETGQTNSARAIPRVSALAVNRAGTQILAGFSDGSMMLLEAEFGNSSQTFIALDNGVVGMAFIEGTDLFTASGSDNALRIWDTITGRQLQTFDVDASVTALTTSRDGKSAATGLSNGTLRIWDIQGSAEITRIVENLISAVSVSPDGSLVAVVGGSAEVAGKNGATGTINVRSLQTQQAVQTLFIQGDNSLFSSVAFSPDGRFLAAGTSSGSLALWETTNFQNLATIDDAQSGFILALAFSPDGRWLATGAADNTIVLWDTATAQQSRALVGHTGGIFALAFNADGTRLLSGSSDTTMRLWDVTGGAALQEFQGHAGPVRAVALNDDSTRALSGAGFPDNTVRVWDAAGGRELRRFGGHDRGINGVAFIPGSQDILSASADGTLRLWDTNNGIELRQFEMTNDRGRTITIKSLALSSDGNRVVIGVSDTPNNTVRVLQLIPDKATLLAWVAQNRFVRPLDCNERLLFGLESGGGQAFVAAGEGAFAPLLDDNGDVLLSLDNQTPLNLLETREPGAATVRVCTLNGEEGRVETALLAAGGGE